MAGFVLPTHDPFLAIRWVLSLVVSGFVLMTVAMGLFRNWEQSRLAKAIGVILA